MKKGKPVLIHGCGGENRFSTCFYRRSTGSSRRKGFDMKKVLNGILFSALFLITMSSCGGMDPIPQVKIENALNGSEMNLPMKFDSGLYLYNPLSTRVESDLDFADIDAQLQKNISGWQDNNRDISGFLFVRSRVCREFKAFLSRREGSKFRIRSEKSVCIFRSDGADHFFGTKNRRYRFSLSIGEGFHHCF